MTRFEFATATRIVFGPGSLREIGKLVREFGRSALIVTGQNPGRADKLISLLSDSQIDCHTFPTAGEPDIGTVERGVEFAKSRACDVVIGFGGGSPIDAGKAIAAMVTNPGQLLDYLEVVGKGQALARSPAPFLAIPTTAGTGSEVTRNAVLASPEHHVKVSLRSPLMLPRIALVDPELTYDLPPSLTASTGLDALTQLIEPYVSARANPMTDALCVDGLRRVARSLRKAFQQGADATAREDMSVASLFGGLALANAGLGAVHGFAGPIGGMFPAPHGAVCAALLPWIMETNVHALEQRAPGTPSEKKYAEVARLLTGGSDAPATDGIVWVRQLVADLQVPALRAYGITAADIPSLVQRAQNASSMKANPIALTAEELSGALARAI